MYRTLLVPLDGSALGEGALPTAAYLAQRMGAGVTLVRAASDAKLVGQPYKPPAGERLGVRDKVTQLAGGNTLVAGMRHRF